MSESNSDFGSGGSFLIGGSYCEIEAAMLWLENYTRRFLQAFSCGPKAVKELSICLASRSFFAAGAGGGVGFQMDTESGQLFCAHAASGVWCDIEDQNR